MISIELALELKAAGLIWQTTNYDFFAIPDRGFDDRVFILADMMAYTELIQGWPVVAFHGTAEWALDYILTSDVVWVPTEEQLRDVLASYLGHDDEATPLVLTYRGNEYACSIQYQGEKLTYAALTAGEAYAQALLQVLRSQN